MKIATLLIALCVSSAAMAQQIPYTLQVDDSPNRMPGMPRPLVVGVTDPKTGQSVTQFDLVNGSKMRWILFDTNLRTMKDEFPTLRPDGKWSADVALTGGMFYLFAEFKPHGQKPVVVKSATNLSTRGMMSHLRIQWQENLGPVKFGEDSVILQEFGLGLQAGQAAILVAHLTTGELQKPVTDLVEMPNQTVCLTTFASQDGQRAFTAQASTTSEDAARLAKGDVVLRFIAPSPGIYRLFLEFQRKGQPVRTIAFSVRVAA